LGANAPTEAVRPLDPIQIPLSDLKIGYRVLDPIRHDAHAPCRRISSEAVPEALIVRWEAADRGGGKPLQAILPTLVRE
jgi:hypothetical protein